MSDMPKEIWAWQVDKDQGAWDLDDDNPEYRTKYVRADSHSEALDGAEDEMMGIVNQIEIYGDNMSDFTERQLYLIKQTIKKALGEDDEK